MMNPTQLDRIAKRPGDMGLTGDFIECCGAPLSGDCLICHGSPITEYEAPGDGRAPPYLGETDTVATFRSWRSSRISDYEDPTTTLGRALWRKWRREWDSNPR
jgi:hypothetical protein